MLMLMRKVRFVFIQAWRAMRRIVVQSALVKLPSVSGPFHARPLSDNTKQNIGVTAANAAISLILPHVQRSFRECRSPQEGIFARLGGRLHPTGRPTL
jgi:hypothetical protein